MHRHAIVRRWADLDALNHVNNVRYAEWSKDALLAAQRDGAVPSGALWPATVTVTYLRPVLLSPAPVWVETEFGDDRVARQTIYEGEGADRVDYATIETTLAPEPEPFAAQVDGDRPYPVFVRRVETAPDGRVDYPRMYEYFQEARISTMWRAGGVDAAGSFVVARVSIALGAPLSWRAEAYPAHTWVGRIGRSSLDLITQIRDGDRVLAQGTAVLVGFDLDAQTSRPFSEVERDAYAALVPAPITSGTS